MAYWFSNKLVSCGIALSLILSTSVYPAQAQSPHKTIWETRVFVEPKCPTDPPPPPDPHLDLVLGPMLVSLFAFLIPKVIDFGVSFASKALQAKADEEKEKNKPIVVSAVGAADNFYKFYEDSPFLDDARPVIELAQNDACIVVIRGNFGQSSSAPVPDTDCENFKSDALREKGNACKWLHQQGVVGSSNDGKAIGVFLEAKMKFSEERSSFRLEPNYFGYFIPIKESQAVDGSYDLTFNFSFESAAAGETATPFGLAILPFLKLANPKGDDPTVLTKGNNALVHKSSGWTPALKLSEQQTAELKRVKDLYDARKALKEKIADIISVLPGLEAKTNALKTEVSTVSIAAPPAPITGEPFTDGQSEAIRRMNDELFDDILVTARLDADPSATPVPGDTAIEQAQKRIVRQQKLRSNAAYRAKVTELKSTAELGLAKLSEKKKTDADLRAKDEAIKSWAFDKKGLIEHKIGPFSVRVSITEQPYLPTNYFLLTAAEALANSKKEITDFMSQNAAQALGLESRDIQVKKISDQAQLLVTAMTALNTAQHAQATFDALPATATEQQKLDAKLILDTAKINANMAYLKAGLDPPFKDAFGG